MDECKPCPKCDGECDPPYAPDGDGDSAAVAEGGGGGGAPEGSIASAVAGGGSGGGGGGCGAGGAPWPLPPRGCDPRAAAGAYGRAGCYSPRQRTSFYNSRARND